MKKVYFICVLFILTMCFVSNQSYAAGAWTGNVNIIYGFKTFDSDDMTVTGDDLVLIEIEEYDLIWTMSDQFEEDFKLAVDRGTEFGINADFGPKSWPVCFAIGFFRASSDDSWSGSLSGSGTFYESTSGTYMDVDFTYTGKAKLKVTTQELRLGVKKIFEVTPTIRPYVAGGLAKVSAKANVPYSIDGTFAYSDGTSFSGPLDSLNYKHSDSSIGYWLSGGAYWTFAKQYNLGIEVSYSKAKMDFGDGMEAEGGGFHYGLFMGYHW